MLTFLRILTLASLMFVLPSLSYANKLLMPGDVIKGHIKEEEACEKCHKKFDKAAQAGLCMDCHKDVGKDVKEKLGYHGTLHDDETDCKDCHTEHKGRNVKIANFDHKKFDHTKTDFTLKGGHQKEKVKCSDCHQEKKRFREAPSYCNDCHKKDDKHKGGLGTDCIKCHVEKDWKTARFDHDKTKFKLLYKHVDVKCNKCHIDNKFKDTPMLCISCHKKDDKHKKNFGQKCESCHIEKGWKSILFNHDLITKYPLNGKHSKVKCISCHKGDLYKDKLKTNCYSCHQKDDKHKQKFGEKCESCHVENDWKKIPFDHTKDTKYPLEGKHSDVKCVSCHKGDLYKDKLKTNCFSCHEKDDKHKQKFGDKCESCHVVKDWKKIPFDHAKDTKYPLLGKHKDVKCVTCHKGDLYKDKLKDECFSCHEKDDKHKGQEGKKCESCHSEKDWKKTTFSHNTMSKFLLLGRHALVNCKKCHDTVTFKDAKQDCWSCHKKDDVHKRKFGMLCQSCHNTRNWKAWDFDHNKTHFKLDGPHAKIGCYKCHDKSMNEKVVQSVTCGSCHDRDDVHNGSYGDQCQRCHTGSKWKDVKMPGRR